MIFLIENNCTAKVQFFYNSYNIDIAIFAAISTTSLQYEREHTSYTIINQRIVLSHEINTTNK